MAQHKPYNISRKLVQLHILFAKGAGIFAVLVGAVVLTGWWFNVPYLKSLVPSWIAMAVNTAVSFALLGIALWLSVDDKHPRILNTILVPVCASVAGSLGFLNAFEYISGIDVSIHELLFKEPENAPGTLAPNRMAFTTAVDFVLLSVALLLINLKGFKAYIIPQIFAIFTALTGYLTFTVYLYGIAPHFEGLAFYTQMAANTAITFIVLGIGVLFSKPDKGIMVIASSDSLGGMTLRRMLPATILITLVLGGFILWGELKGLYSAQFKLSVSLLLTTVLFVVLTFKVSMSIFKIERERIRVEHELIKAEQAVENAMMINLRKDESLLYTSHELRSPLHSIIAGSSMLQEGIFGSLNQKQAEYIRLIKKNSEHLLQVINDMLDIAKIDAGKLPLRMQAVHLPTLIDETFHLIEPLCTEKNQTFLVKTGSRIPDTIKGDSTRLKQVLCNLLTNAVKFTPQNKRIWLMCDVTSQNELVFSIKDEGPGIADADLERILSPFEQGRQTNLSGIKGTGLGLSLSKKLIDLHQGRLEIHSQVGKGSEFKVYLPLNRKQPKKA